MKASAQLILLLCVTATSCSKEKSADTAAPETTKETTDTKEGAAKEGDAPEPPSPEAPDTWKEFVGEENRYTVMFPGSPLVQPQQTATEFGDLKFQAAMYLDPGETFGFFTAAMILPVPKDAPFDLKAGLDGGRDEMLKSMDSKADSEKEITFEGLQGREITYHGTGPIPGKPIEGIVRIYASDKPPTMWQANAIFMGKRDEKLAMKFLDSFVPRVK